MYPCYIPVLGELKGSRSYKTYPAAKVLKLYYTIDGKNNKLLFFYIAYIISQKNKDIKVALNYLDEADRGKK